MRPSPRKTLTTALLASASVMALSIGSAQAGAYVGEHTVNPFVFGDKEVVFTTCDDFCGTIGVTAIEDDPVGFRLMFPAPEPIPDLDPPNDSYIAGNVGSFASGVLAPGGVDSSALAPISATIGFTVTVTNPLFKIIGAQLAADAGVMASYSYTANGEEGGGDTGTASATGEIDIELTGTDNPLMIDLGALAMMQDGPFDDGVGASGLASTDMGASTTDPADIEMVMDALAPASTYSFDLDWRLAANAICDLGDLRDINGPPTCEATAFAGISHIDIRFKQVPEPGALGLMGLGVAGLGLARRRKRA